MAAATTTTTRARIYPLQSAEHPLFSCHAHPIIGSDWQDSSLSSIILCWLVLLYEPDRVRLTQSHKDNCKGPRARAGETHPHSGSVLVAMRRL